MKDIATPLGQLLVSAGLIDVEELNEALALQIVSNCRLGEALVRSGAVSETDVTQVLSNQLSVAWVSLNHVEFTRALLDLISSDLAIRYLVVPVHCRVDGSTGQILYLAMNDPTDVQAMRDASAYSNMRVRPLIAPPSELQRIVGMHYAIPVTPDVASGQ